MRLHLLLFKVLLCVLLPIAASSSPTGDVNPSRISHLSSLTPRWDDFQTSNRPASRCLLSSPGKKETALIATLDGTISLVERYTMKVLWSFYSGPSIYSSYQAPVKQENDKGNASGLSSSLFFDYGDDWELYMHNRHLGEKVKLAMPIEDIIKSTPQILEDGGVMLGSKKTTVFLVDAKTGRLINTYKSSDDEKSDLYNKDIEEWVEPDSPKPFPLYITRIDYSLQAFAPNSGKVLWNMTVSEIGAALFCPDTLNSFGGAPLLAGYELGSGLDGHLNMPLPCQSKALVIRLRGNNMAEFLSRPDSLPATSGKETILPDPAQSHLLPLLDTHEDLMPLSPASELSLSTQPKLAGLSTKSQKILPASSSELMLSSELQLHKPSDCNDDNKLGLSLSSQSSEMFAKGFTAVILIVICVGFIYCCHLVGKQETDFNQQPGCLDGKSEPSKKKRTRKLGKKNSNVEQKDKIESPVKEDNFANIENDNKVWLNHNKLLGGVLDGRRVGKLFVFNEEIAKGSNGTVVLQGNYDGRPVAVKRLVQAHHDVALKEIQNLIASDQHPNIVRWFGVEYDQDFVYLSLERCTCSLNDLILAYSDSSQNYVFHEDQSMRPMIEHKAQLDLVKNIMPDIKLWKSNGCPSPLLLKLMRDVVSGLVHLHELGIVHRDLKPQNVLISKERSLCAKLSDMGISKRLPEDMSSLGYHATGYGSSGWQAPEQLLHGRQTRSVDMFSLGCVLFFCMTGGRHPFGDRLERDINIVKNQVDLFLVEYIPEAVDLFSRLLDANPELRPKAEEVLCHPLFWNSEMRLSFLRDTSDRVELEDRETNSELLKALESTAPIALGAKWDEKMEVAFIANIGHYRRYKFDSVRDLLRVMRNKLNHYRELPKDIQGILGSVPGGFDGYFASRFPKLLIEVYKVVHRYCKDEECFKKYFDSCVI